MRLEGRQLANYVIAKRMRDKARAPYWTDACNALKKGERKMNRASVGNTLCYDGETHISRTVAIDLLQAGKSVTLKQWECTRERNPDDFFDEGEWRLAAETVVKIKTATSTGASES